jgi:hypothetical protein
MAADQHWEPGNRAQWAAVVTTVVISAALALGLPRLAEATAPQDKPIEAGERVEAGGVSIEVPAGWATNAGASILAINKGDAANLILFPPAADPTTPADAVEAQVATFTDATVGDLTPFTTDSGLEAASVTVEQAGEITVLVAFSDGTNLGRGQVNAPSDGWESVKAEVEAMLRTVEFTEVPAS